MFQVLKFCLSLNDHYIRTQYKIYEVMKSKICNHIKSEKKLTFLYVCCISQKNARIFRKT